MLPPVLRYRVVATVPFGLTWTKAITSQETHVNRQACPPVGARGGERPRTFVTLIPVGKKLSPFVVRRIKRRVRVESWVVQADVAVTELSHTRSRPPTC